ncbi:DNA ligase, partial [Candidatus Microgenomates bacterium]
YLNGVSLIDKPLSERRNILEKVLKPKSILSLNSQIETDDPNEIRQYHAEQLSAGLEGVLVKKVSGVYQPGRSGFNWVKLKEVENSEGKLSDTIDCVVMGYYWGKGKRSGFGIGAFLVGVAGEDKILTIAKIGTGLTDEQFKLLYGRLGKIECSKQPDMYVVEKSLTPDVWVEPRIVVEIAADEITTSPSHSAGYSLRFPRLVKFRDDKSVTEITTYTEIEQMYGQ